VDGSDLVFTVAPIVIPLVLAIGVALPFIRARNTAQDRHRAGQFESCSQLAECVMEFPTGRDAELGEDLAQVVLDRAGRQE